MAADERNCRVGGARASHRRAAALGLVAVVALISSSARETTPAERRDDAIARARVWQASDIGAKNLLLGPGGSEAFPPFARIACRYHEKTYPGASPKFACTLPSGDTVKVKYGGTNGEVYGEVAASRLFWALGFGADRMYPVRVVCASCPKALGGRPLVGGASLFDPATIERKAPGKEIDKPLEGWAWNELVRVDPVRGGATRAQRDALMLLAAFVQHTDSKADNQALLCLAPHDTKRVCREPWLIIGDLGQTFGRANLFNAPDLGAVNLDAWSRVPIWKDPDRCIANLARSATGTLWDPQITEPGRRFLAGLLVELSDAQIRDLFVAARVRLRPRTPVSGRSGFPTPDEWVVAFKDKRAQIVEHTCPR